MKGGLNSNEPHDPFDLNRFLTAQEGVYTRVLAELAAGRKRSHWMWFVFPQLAGLGRSSTARYYAIKSREEGLAYLDHPVLGARLRECTEAVLKIDGKSATEVFGYPDDIKLRSSMTLFAALTGPESLYARVLAKFFAGNPDAATLRLLETMTVGRGPFAGDDPAR